MVNFLITLYEIYPNQSDRTNDLIERELNCAQHRSLFPRDNKPMSFSDMVYDWRVPWLYVCDPKKAQLLAISGLGREAAFQN